MLGAAAVALAVVDHGNATSHLDARLKSDATAQARSLDEYFARSRDIVLISAQNPALHAFNDAPGDVREKRLRATGTIAQVGAALTYLERLYPGTIGEACYIDRGGPEIARAVRGVLAAPRTLSNDESGSTFFHATFTGGLASVYQARPYRSPDTQDWVISNSTPVPGADGQPAAILHFEVALDSFRVRAAVSPFRVLVLDRATGAIVMDSRHRQLGSARLGEPPTNGTQTLAARAAGTGLASLDGRQDGFAAIAAAAGNANRWLVVSVAPTGTGFGIRDFGAVPIGLLLLALLALAGAGVAWRRATAHDAAGAESHATEEARRRALEELHADVTRSAAGLAVAASEVEERARAGDAALGAIGHAAEEVAADAAAQSEAAVAARAAAEANRERADAGVAAAEAVHRRADEPARPERGHRGRAGRRAGTRLRRRRGRGGQARGAVAALRRLDHGARRRDPGRRARRRRDRRPRRGAGRRRRAHHRGDRRGLRRDRPLRRRRRRRARGDRRVAAHTAERAQAVRESGAATREVTLEIIAATDRLRQTAAALQTLADR